MANDKSTLDQIRDRFDADVERFSSLQTGQQTAPDSTLCMQWVADAALAVTPAPARVLDLGCGAGNYSLSLLSRIADPSAVSVTLVDLSQPMLARAEARLREAGVGEVLCLQGDLLSLSEQDVFPAEAFDVVMAAAVLHHLRAESAWRTVFAAVYRAVAKGGGWWIADLILQADARVDRCMWDRYGEYLVALQDEALRDEVFGYIDREDSPRSLMWQLKLMENVGFRSVDVLHKNISFAAFGGIK